MRVILSASIFFTLTLASAIGGHESDSAVTAQPPDSAIHDAKRREGQAIFRYDTFGDEQLWTDVLRMHEVIATVPPATALAVGLKVDVDALPPALIRALKRGQVDLTNPSVTVELLRLNAVVGVRGALVKRES